MRTHYPPAPAPREHGFTLVELLVAVTIGLLILAGMTTLFVRNSSAQAEIEKANRQIENGRFGIDTLGNDLRNAGFYGEYDPTELPTPGTLPDPCANTLDSLRGALPLHIQGYDNAASAVACISDVKPNTDVLVVRHTRTCISGAANCDEEGVEGPLFQASLCDNDSELGSATLANHYALDTDTSQLTRHRRDCTATAGSGTLAPARRYLTHIYFVANNDRTGDGIPTLKRAELLLRNGSLGFYEMPLAEGIENMQLEYGIDTSGDGVADLFTADPASADGCTTPECVPVNWRRVMSVKISLLSRNTEASPGFTDTRTYVLGNKADGTVNRIAAANDSYKRHVFQALVPLPNPVGRRHP